MQMISSDILSPGNAGDALCGSYSCGTVVYVISPSLPMGREKERNKARRKRLMNSVMSPGFGCHLKRQHLFNVVPATISKK